MIPCLVLAASSLEPAAPLVLHARRRVSVAALSLIAIAAGCGSSEGGNTGGGGAGAGGRGTTSSTATTTSTGSTTSSNTNDPFDAARQACVDRINELRATKGLAPYARWSAVEACVDEEVTHDETVGIAHDAFFNGACSGAGGQGECMGTAQTPDGIRQCLDAMWGEKDQPGCGGCDSCPFAQSCADCAFQGCGHYMAMSAKTFTQAACGFSSAPGKSWSAIDYR